MPDNLRGRKRKQPASPSPTTSRPSPYHPNIDNRNNNNTNSNSNNTNANNTNSNINSTNINNSNNSNNSRTGRQQRRQNSTSGPAHQHQQQQYSQQQQHQYSQQNQRGPSRLAMSNAGESSVPSAQTGAPPPLSSRGPATPAAVDSAEDTQLQGPPQDAAKEKQNHFFFWEFVTDDALKDWSGAGSLSVKDKLVELATDRTNEPEISIIFQELIKTAVDSRLSAFMVARFLTDYIENVDTGDSGLDLRRIFLQTVNIFESTETAVPPSPNLVKLLQDLHPRILSEESLGLYLETPTLIALNIVTSLFTKKAVRVTTALVYKQRKHNLLREESEGFSKLITEFFTASYSASPLEVVGRTGERVKGLIGAFELDPGRVLDILLDTAACTVVSNARFFVRLLKGSAWWPQQLQGLVEDDGHKGRQETKEAKEKEKERVDREFFDRLGKEGISVFFEDLESGKGNKVAAQLLGFKFRYYQKDDVREPTPENLLVLSALLIKIGFVDLADLYPHLAPQDDEGMTGVLSAWKAKLDEKQRSGKRNALMMAGALVDDSAPPPRSKPSNNNDEKKPEEIKKEEEPRPKKDDNQKLVLLKYLLAVGALPEAMFILGKYPWLPGPSDDIAEHLARIIAQSLDGVYPTHRPPRVHMGSRKIASAQGGKTGGVDNYDQPRRKPMVTFTVSNLKLKTGDIEYRFFWDEWKEGVPICREPKHVVVLMETLGRVLGVRIGRDAGVITKVCRIGRDVLKDPNCTPEDKKSWIGLARTLIIPAISLTDGNQGVVNEVWKLLECFSTETRYSLYGEWTSVTSKRIPELKNKVAATERETRDLLKRISKTNVKQMARQLAKVATSNPVTVMQVVLGQVEGYDNLIECVVDAARYFTPLGFDAVGFCVLNSMSNEAKKRVQADGMLTSKWLQSLAVFCGKIYTRYHTQMDPAPILEYVARQLKRNRSVELIVLQQLMQSMAGVNPETNLNDAQLQGLAGGEVLRKQILKAFRDKKAEDTIATTKRLSDTLLSASLAAELLILIAQERQTCIFRIDESAAPLKVLANLFDEIHVVLSQYLDLMKMGFSAERFEEVLPSVGPLCLKYGIDPPIAWWVYRLGIRSRMKKVESPDGDDVEMKDVAETTDSPPEKKSPWNPVLEKMIEEVKPILPDQVWTKLSVSFYVTFWQLEIYDIFVPMEAYQAETNRIMVAVRALDMDRSDPSIAGQSRKREKRDELMETHSRLSAELKLHIRDHNLARRRLGTEKEHWFSDDRFNQREITDTFIQHCIFPRVMISPNDASFCSRFIREVHKMGTPKFHTIGVYDSIFGKGLGTVIFICTQREAENYGRFLKEVLTDLHAWHADRALYEREAHGSTKNLAGFIVKGQSFDWEDFRKILYKWHKTLHAAVKNCLSSKEYMHIRNTIVVLKHVAEFFPAVDWIGRTVVERVEDLVRSEKREDLKIAAMTLLGMLKKREKEWMIVAAFQKSEALAPGMMKPSPTPTPSGPSDKPASPGPKQQQPGRPASALTKEFRPNSTSDSFNANQQSQAKAVAAAAAAAASTPSLPSKPQAGDKEDGEVDDGRRDRGQPPNLPQRPQQLPQDHRKPMTPSREPQQHLQSQQQPPHRPPTPRRDEQRQPNDVRRQDMIRTPSNRNPVFQHPQHQLPERPDIARQTTLERRDTLRDARDSPRQDSRGRQEGRLPEKPLDRRHSPRRESRESRESRDIPHRHEVDRRGPPPVRDVEFQRPALPPGRDERGPPRKDERPLESEGRSQPGAGRILQQNIEPDDRRRDERDGGGGGRRRGERHEPTGQQSGRLNDYPMDRSEHPDHRVSVQDSMRKSELLLPSRHLQDPPNRHHPADDMLAQRAPPAGPRSNFDRRGPPPQKELFTGPPSGNQMRGPPSGPHRPSEQFREPRHPPSGNYHHQDPNHGRLNPPDPVIPKGPRERNALQFGPRTPGSGSLSIRGASQVAAQQAAAAAAQQAAQQPTLSPSTPVTRPLPSPSVERKLEMPPPTTERHSAPTTPTVDTASIHPDRLKAMGVSSQQNPTGQQQQQQPQGQHSRANNFTGPNAPSPINTQVPPLGPRSGDRTISPGGAPVQVQKPASPPTGPARRDGIDEARNQRRRILNVQSHLTGDEVGREIRGRGRRNGSTPSTPITPGGRDIQAPSPSLSRQPSSVDLRGITSVSATARPQQELDRRMSSNNLIDSHSRRSSVIAIPDGRDMRQVQSVEDLRSAVEPHTSSRGRHHRSERERSDRSERERDREPRERDRDRDRDRRVVEAEREREREREFAGTGSGRESRKGSDRGGSSGIDRKERDRDREREHRDRGEGRERGARSDEREREGGSRRDSERRTRGEKHPRIEGSGQGEKREDAKRRRRAAEGWI